MDAGGKNRRGVGGAERLVSKGGRGRWPRNLDTTTRAREAFKGDRGRIQIQRVAYIPGHALLILKHL